MENNTLLPVVVAAVVFLLSILGAVLFSGKAKTSERLKKLREDRDTGGGGNDTDNDYFLESLRSEREPAALAVFLASMFKAIGMDVEAFRVNNQLRFYQAGIQSPDAPIYYLFFTRVLSVVFVLVAILIATRDDAAMLDYIIALLIAMGGLFGADLLIKNKQEKRKQMLQRSFPDALDLLLACVESGLALDGALLRVCKELGRAHPDITQELNRTRVELSLLNDRAQALNNLAERNGLPAFRALVTALLQSEKFGTSLTDTLRVMSEDYRTQRLMRAEEKAGRLPALITVPLIVFLLPALFLIILGPAVIGIVAAFK
ncbi:MAG TPA: type II secretion system F family protein [Rickettsiales bacterium]|nr:type II secretion system F family protein [Rickettsiales bacterium]